MIDNLSSFTGQGTTFKIVSTSEDYAIITNNNSYNNIRT